MKEKNILFKGGNINSYNRMVLQFEIWEGLRQGYDPINILFASVGGQIFQALEFYKYIKDLKPNVNIFNIGEVRSASIIVFLAFDNRYYFPNSKFHMHSVRLKEGADKTEEKIKQNSIFTAEMISIIESTIQIEQSKMNVIKTTEDDIWLETQEEIEGSGIAKPYNKQFDPNTFVVVHCVDEEKGLVS